MNALLAAYTAQQKGGSQQGARPQQTSNLIQKPRDHQAQSDEIETCFRKLRISEKDTQGTGQYFHQGLERPSDQIRLLLLAPAADRKDPIDCTLQVVNLTEAKALNFDAISYACGDQTKRKDIFIDGLRLSITSNLHDALVGLRHPTMFQRLWADAICIHQHDLQEKSQQILLMRDVYSLATEVIIWLGESDTDLDALFRELSTVDPGDMTKQTSKFYQMFQFAQGSNQLLQGFIKLFKKPWFSRVWCTQECLLASKPVVICGNYRTPWKVINTALMVIDMIWPNKKSAIQRQLQDASTHSMSGAMFITYEYAKKVDLGMILMNTSSKDATDPRDKIYAILGVLPLETRKLLRPDYSQTLSQVYQNATLAMCREHSVLNPLWAAAGRRADPELGIPTWCINFSDTQWHRTLTALHEFPIMATKYSTGAAGDAKTAPPSYIEHDPQTSRLIVDGTIVGSLQQPVIMSFTTTVRELDCIEQLIAQSEISSVPVKDNRKAQLSDLQSQIVFQYIQDIKAVTERVYHHDCARYGGQFASSRIESGQIWSTFSRSQPLSNLVNDIWTKAGLKSPTDYSIFEHFLRRRLHSSNNNMTKASLVPTTYWDIEIAPHLKAQTSQAQLVDDCIIKSILALARRLPDRSFIITDTGYVGCTGLDVRAGDLLCVVFKCAQPLILRPNRVDNYGRQMYDLVASAWINGLMKGEIMRKGGDIVRNRFVLL